MGSGVAMFSRDGSIVTVFCSCRQNTLTPQITKYARTISRLDGGFGRGEDKARIEVTGMVCYNSVKYSCDRENDTMTSSSLKMRQR